MYSGRIGLAGFIETEIFNVGFGGSSMVLRRFQSNEMHGKCHEHRYRNKMQWGQLLGSVHLRKCPLELLGDENRLWRSSLHPFRCEAHKGFRRLELSKSAVTDLALRKCSLQDPMRYQMGSGRSIPEKKPKSCKKEHFQILL